MASHESGARRLCASSLQFHQKEHRACPVSPHAQPSEKKREWVDAPVLDQVVGRVADDLGRLASGRRGGRERPTVLSPGDHKFRLQHRDSKQSAARTTRERPDSTYFRRIRRRI